MAAKNQLPLHTKIFIGLIVGAVAGILANVLAGGAVWLEWTVDKVAQPAGQIFLSMLFMVVIPLIFASLSLGVAQLGDIRKLGRIGLKTFAYFVLVTALATTIGLTLVNLLEPGIGVPDKVVEQLRGAYAGEARSKAEQVAGLKLGVDMVVKLVPRNPVAAAAQGDFLAWIFFSLVFGIAVGLLPRERAAP
ncbi:MAG: dicarboxylate/amino acid:cation symporter, partial [Terriglobia bacterium]